MNKGCCKRCAKEMIESIEGKFYRQYCPIDEFWINETQFNERWEENIVFCGKQWRIIDTMEGVPSDCFYILEHMVNQNVEISNL